MGVMPCNRGNENIIEGTIVCDFCVAKQDKKEMMIYLRYDLNERAFFAKHERTEIRIKNCVRSIDILRALFAEQCCTITDVKFRGKAELVFTKSIWDDLVSCKEMM
jgi:hypothetical protein